MASTTVIADKQERKFYSNVLTNGDIMVGYVTIGGVQYAKYLEEDTRMYYFIDSHTSNLSFIRTANDLYNLGFRNYKFMLKIYDANLLGVDPYSPIITPEQIKRVNVECKRNIWYYIREIARIPEEGGAIGPGGGIRYQLNRGNLAATWCFAHNIDHYLVLPRQIGKTKSELQNILWVYLFSSNTKMMFLCKDGNGSKANLRTLKEERDLLPLYLQSKMILNSDGELKLAKGDNATYLLNPHNGNRVDSFAPGNSMDAADRCGRGLTQAVQFFDEVEFTKFVNTIIEAAGPAFNTSSRTARANGAPYCRVFTTTPGNLDSEPVMTTNDFRRQMMRFSESLYDMSTADAKAVISENSAVNILYIEYSYTQLGKDENWFISTCKVVSNNKIKIRREILLKRIRGTNTSPFEAEDLEEINNKVCEPIEEIYINKIYPLLVYTKLNKNIPYILSVDCAAGGIGDNSAITLIDPYKARPVADLRSNIITTTKLCSILISLVVKYVPRSIVVIERNSMGAAVIDSLRTSAIAGNLYFDSNKYFVPDASQHLDAKGFATVNASNLRSYGVYTNNTTRPIMFNILFAQVREHKSDFVTKYIVSDLNALVRTPTGKVAAANGAHDDSIMSYLIGMYTLFNGSNLARYGFVKGDKSPDEDKQKTRREIFEELPPELQDMFKESMGMETSEEADMRMREESDRIRSLSGTQGIGGTGENINFSVNEDVGIVEEEPDMSFLDYLNS